MNTEGWHFLNRLLLFVGSLWNASKVIASAAATFRISDKYAVLNKSQDVTQSGVMGAFCELRPLGGCEFPLEAVEEPVQHKALAVVY